MSKPIRVSDQAQQFLQVLAEKEGKTIGRIIDEWVEQRQREALFDAADAAYAVLRQDQTAWHNYQQDLALDNTSLDGLDPHENWQPKGKHKNK